MHVRAATLKDIETLVDFGKRLTKESPIFSKQGFSESGAREVFELLIRRYGSIFIVSDEYSNPVGAVIGAINSDWRTGHKIAFEQGVYVLPEYRGTGAATDLIKTFKQWAEIYKADRIQIGTITGIQANRTVKFYEKLGFELVGYVLEKEI